MPRTVDVSWLTGVVRVRREWEPEELIGSWTLLGEDWRLLANKGFRVQPVQKQRQGPR